MNLRSILSLSAIVALGLAVFPSDAISQQKSLKEILIGTWTYVSLSDQYEDGSKVDNWGPGLKGSLSFDSNGRFTRIIIGGPQPNLKTNDPRRPDAPIVVLFGTYTVNEADKTVATHVEGASFSPRIGTKFTETMTINGDTLISLGSPRKDQRGTFSPRGELKQLK